MSSFKLLIRKLEALQTSFGEQVDKKTECLLQLSRCNFTGTPKTIWRYLLRYHETLLYLVAYPDSPAVLSLACEELRTLSKRITRRTAPFLEGSGILGTVIAYPLDLRNAEWLVQNYPSDVDIDWDLFEDDDALGALLPHLAGAAEESVIDDENVEVLDWINQARGEKSAAVWLVERMNALRADTKIRETLYDSMNVPLTWKITDFTASRSGNCYPAKSIFYHREPLSRKAPALKNWIRKKIPDPARVSRKKALELIAVARKSLLVRDRELYPITYADPGHVQLYQLERGLQIATFAIIPERRLLLEGLWGYLVLKNGLPVGYGMFSALFSSADVAYNIFETFRGGESALIFAQLLRVIHHQTGATTFSVEKYQFGHENEEAIESGAFWFYYKLGFRPFGAKTLKRIQAERKKIESRSSYRTPAHVLVKLCVENLFFHLNRRTKDVLGYAPYSKIGSAVTRLIAEKYGAERNRARRQCRKKVTQALGCALPNDTMSGEFCLLVSMFENLHRWPARDRKALAQVLRNRVKGGDREFVLSCNRHSRLKKAVLRLL